MIVRLTAAGLASVILLTSCSVRDDSDKTPKIPKNDNKVEIIQENNQSEVKIKDMQDIIKMSLETAYKGDEKLKVLQPDVSIDKSGRTISLIFDVDAFVDNFGLDREVGKRYFGEQLKTDDWLWMKDKCFSYYGKEAGMTAASEITIIIVNKNDNKEIKRF